MDLPLAILLIPYTLVVLLAFLFLFFNIYHLAKFGLQSGKTSLLIGLYIVAFIASFAIASEALVLTDWSARFTLADLLPFLSNTQESLVF